MRIAFITANRTTGPKGDYHRYTLTLESLQAMGHDLVVISPKQPDQSFSQKLRGKLLSKLGFKVRTECEKKTLCQVQSSILSQIHQCQFDIVFSQSTHFTAYLRTSIPVVNWVDAVYDCIVDLFPSHQHLDFWSRRAGHCAECQALRHSNLTILTSV